MKSGLKLSDLENSRKKTFIPARWGTSITLVLGVLGPIIFVIFIILLYASKVHPPQASEQTPEALPQGKVWVTYTPGNESVFQNKSILPVHELNGMPNDRKDFKILDTEWKMIRLRTRSDRELAVIHDIYQQVLSQPKTLLYSDSLQANKETVKKFPQLKWVANEAEWTKYRLVQTVGLANFFALINPLLGLSSQAYAAPFPKAVVDDLAVRKVILFAEIRTDEELAQAKKNKIDYGIFQNSELALKWLSTP